MIAIREDIAMAFFKRELSPVKRFKNALRDKQVARQKLADRLSVAETVLGEKRVATASCWRTRLRRWLRQSSRLPPDLVPVPPRSWRLSQKARRQCGKQPA